MTGKKKDIAADTPKWEDVLEIPKEEQPWPLPEGWKWVKVGDILNLQAGKNITSKFINSIKTADYQYPCYGGNGVRGYVKEFNHNGEFFIIGRQGALCGNIHHVCGKFYATEHAVVVTSKTYYIDINYAGNYLEFMNLNQYATATAQPGLAVSNILKLPFLLPPLSIQQRIVTTIESLFSRLDEATEKVQAVIDSHEARKQAILHKAFSGELTKKWREENGVSFESWEEKKLVDICIIKSGTTIDKAKELPSGKIPYIKVSDMNLPDNFWEIVKSSRYIDDARGLSLFPKGSIIFPKRGGAIHTNKKRIVRKQEILADLNIMAIIPDNKVVSLIFVYYWFLTIDLSTLNNGTNVPQINNKDLLPLLIVIPTKYEQDIIINIIERLFIDEDKIIKKALFVNNQINIIKHYLLNNIFKGNINLSMG